MNNFNDSLLKTFKIELLGEIKMNTKTDDRNCLKIENVTFSQK